MSVQQGGNNELRPAPEHELSIRSADIEGERNGNNPVFTDSREFV